MRIDQLLHDVESAEAGYWMARSVNDDSAAKQLLQKAQRLWDQAHAEDPQHVDDAWAETRLVNRP